MIGPGQETFVGYRAGGDGCAARSRAIAAGDRSSRNPTREMQRMTARALLHASVATLALSAGFHSAAAQQQPARNTNAEAANTAQGSNAAQNSRTMARECLNGLRAFNDRMDQDGFWLAGWGSGSYGTGATEGRRTGTASQPANTATRAARDRAVTDARAPWTQAGGWGIASRPTRSAPCMPRSTCSAIAATSPPASRSSPSFAMPMAPMSAS